MSTGLISFFCKCNNLHNSLEARLALDKQPGHDIYFSIIMMMIFVAVVIIFISVIIHSYLSLNQRKEKGLAIGL